MLFIRVKQILLLSSVWLLCQGKELFRRWCLHLWDGARGGGSVSVSRESQISRDTASGMGPEEASRGDIGPLLDICARRNSIASVRGTLSLVERERDTHGSRCINSGLEREALHRERKVASSRKRKERKAADEKEENDEKEKESRRSKQCHQ